MSSDNGGKSQKEEERIKKLKEEEERWEEERKRRRNARSNSKDSGAASPSSTSSFMRKSADGDAVDQEASYSIMSDDNSEAEGEFEVDEDFEESELGKKSDNLSPPNQIKTRAQRVQSVASENMSEEFSEEESFPAEEESNKLLPEQNKQSSKIPSRNPSFVTSQPVTIPSSPKLKDSPNTPKRNTSMSKLPLTPNREEAGENGDSGEESESEDEKTLTSQFEDPKTDATGTLEGSSDDEAKTNQSSVEEEGSESGSDAEFSESSDDDNSVEGLRTKYERSKKEAKANATKMRQLVAHIAQYKKFMEYEKETAEEKLRKERETATKASAKLLEQIEELGKENESFQIQYQEMVDEYEARIEKTEEDKKVKHRENIENLQTLIKELTYIEEVNVELTNELGAEKAKVAELQEEVALSKKLIEQMEIKLARQKVSQRESITLNIDTTAPGSEQITELAHQLVEEKKKMELIGQLLVQMRHIALPSTVSGGSAEDDLFAQVQSEKEAHDSTKKALEAEKSKALADKATIEKQQKRIADLIQSHRTALANNAATASAPETANGAAPNPITATISSPDMKSSSLYPTASRRVLISPSFLEAASKAGAKEQSVVSPPEEKKLAKDRSASIFSSAASASGTGIKNDKKKKISLTEAEKLNLFFSWIDDNRVDEISKLIKKSKNIVYLADQDGRTPLHRACSLGAAPIVKLLLYHNADPNKLDVGLWSPLHCAANSASENSEVIKLLLKKQNIKVNVLNEDRNLPLHFYVRNRYFNSDVFQSLISKGTDINSQNFNGETVLHGCIHGGHEKGVEILLKAGADVNICTTRHENTLHWAARLGQVKVVKWLIERGADLEAKGRNGTPFDVAANEETRRAIQEATEKKKLGTSGSGGSIGSNSPVIPIQLKNKKYNRRSVVGGLDKMFTSEDSSNSLIVDPPLPGSFLELQDELEGKTERVMMRSSTTLGSPSLPRNAPPAPIKSERRGSISSGSAASGRSSRSSSVPEAPNSSLFNLQNPERTDGGVPLHSSASKPRTMSRTKTTRTMMATREKKNVDVRTLFPLGMFEMQAAEQKARQNEDKVILIQSVLRKHLAVKAKKEIAGAMIIREDRAKRLLDYETKYAKALHLFVSSFIIPVRDNKSLPKKTKDPFIKVFESIEAIWKVSQNTVTMLTERLSETFGHHTKIGDIYMRIIPELALYTHFSQHYFESLPAFQDKASLAKIAKSCNIADGLTNTLLELLVEPLQYPSKLQELLVSLGKVTPTDHRDRRSFKSVLIRLEGLTNQITSIQREVSNQSDISKIVAKFQPFSFNLNAPGRFYVREGILLFNYKGAMKRTNVVLFSDGILLGRNSSKAELSKFIDFVQLTIHSEAHEYQMGDHKKGVPFVITGSKSTEPIILFCRNEEERDSWIRVIRSVIEDLMDSWKTPGSRKSATLIDPALLNELQNQTMAGLPEDKLNTIGKNSRAGSRVVSRRGSLLYIKDDSSSGSSGSLNSSSGTSPTTIHNKLHNSGGAGSSSKLSNSGDKGESQSVSPNNSLSPTSAMSPNSRLRMSSKNQMDINKLNRKTLDAEMIAVMNQDACNTCYSKFESKVRERFICTRCGNAVCSSCSLKRENGRCCGPCKLADQDHPVTLLELPDILVIHILAYLEINELPKILSTCKELNKLGKNSQAWRMFYLRKGWRPRPEDTNLGLENPEHWRKKCILESKWLSPLVPPVSNLKGHTNAVSCLSLEENLLVSGGQDHTIRLWDAAQGYALNTLKGHNDGLKCVALCKEKSSLYSSSDNQLKCWNLETGKIVSSTKIHSDVISCMQYVPDRGVIITGSLDRSVKIIDIRSMKTVKHLTGHKHGINTLRLYKSILVTGTRENIHIWDLSNEKNNTVLKGQTGNLVRCIAIEGDTILSGGTDSNIRVWEKGHQTGIMQSHSATVTCIQQDENKIVSGGEDGTVHVWGSENRDVVKIIPMPENKPVQALQFNQQGRLATAHSDGIIRLWKF